MIVLENTKLADIQYVPATVGSLYTNPANYTTFIRGLVLHNTGTTSEKVKVHNVPDAAGSVGVADNSNAFLEINLSPKETVNYVFPYPAMLTDTNDALFASTATASTVTVQVLGDRGSDVSY